MRMLNYFLIFVLLAVTVAAPPMPMPVTGKVFVQGEGLHGQQVVVTNLNTGESLTSDKVPSLVTEHGVFLFDMNEFGAQNEYTGTLGNTFKIVACALPECVYNFVNDGKFPKTISLNVGVPTFRCSDGSLVLDSKNCPVDEDTKMWNGLLVTAGTVLAGLAWWLGFRRMARYYWDKGVRLEKEGKKAEGLKNKRRAISMLRLAVDRARAGKYESSIRKG